MRRIALGNHQKPRCVLINAMNYPWTLHPANTRKLALAMVQQCVDKGSVTMARCRMHHEPGGFIDDDQMFIFKNRRPTQCSAPLLCQAPGQGR